MQISFMYFIINPRETNVSVNVKAMVFSENSECVFYVNTIVNKTGDVHINLMMHHFWPEGRILEFSWARLE